MKKFNLEYRRLFNVIFGTVLYVVGVTFFIVPARLITGGLTGYAVLAINYLEQFGFIINLGLATFLINIPVMYLGFRGVSRKFVIYTIISIVLQSIMFSVIDIQNPIFTNDYIGSALFGGLFIGVGAGIALKAGASLGGMDVISQYFAIKKQTSIAMVNLSVNGVLLVLSMIFFEPSVALYTFLGYIVTNVLVEKIHTGYKRVKVEIITDKGEDVREKLLQTYEHGITITKGIGAFTGSEKSILIMVTQSHEVYDLKRSVLSVDEYAFITMSPVRHLNGKFQQIIIK